MRRRIGRRGRSRKRHWLPFRLAFATICAVVITIASVHIVSAAESDVEIQASRNNRNNDIDITRGKSPVQSLQQSLHVKLKGQDSNSFISFNTNRKLQARTNKKTNKNNQSVKQQRGGGRLSNTQLSKLNNLHIHSSVLKQSNGVNKTNSSSRGTNNTRTNANKKRTSNTTKGAHLQSNKNAARNSGGGGINRMKTANKNTAATNANKLLLNNMEQLSGNRGRNRGGNNNKNNRRRSNNNWNNSGKKNQRSRNNNRWRASRSGGKFRGNRWGSSGDKWSSGSSSDWASSDGKSGKSGGSSGGSQSWSTSGDKDSWSSDAWTTRKKRDSWSGVVQWNMEKQCPCTYIKSPHPVAWGETKQMIKVCTCEPTYMPTTYHPT